MPGEQGDFLSAGGRGMALGVQLHNIRGQEGPGAAEAVVAAVPVLTHPFSSDHFPPRWAAAAWGWVVLGLGCAGTAAG